MWLNPNSIYSQIQVTAGLRKVKPHYFFSPNIFRYWKVTSALKWKSTKPLKNNWVWITVRAVKKKIHRDCFRYQGKIWLHGHVFICIMLTSFNIAESNKFHQRVGAPI